MIKKTAIMVFMLSFLAGCGDGGDPGLQVTTPVTLKFGSMRTATRTVERAIPANIVAIRIVISAPDMTTIDSTIQVSGQPSLTVSFNVPSGLNRYFVAGALDANATVLYIGDAYADLSGTPVTIQIVMVENKPDLMFKSFVQSSSSSSSSSGGEFKLVPDALRQAEIIPSLDCIDYEVGNQGIADATNVTVEYWYSDGEVDTCQLFSIPLVPAGGWVAASAKCTAPWITEHFMMLDPYDSIAELDEGNNTDCTGSYYCFDPPTVGSCPLDETPPTFGGINSIANKTSTSGDLDWFTATDDTTFEPDIVYLIYQSTTSGGQNFATPTYTTAPGALNYVVTGLTPGVTYYFVVRAMDLAGNIDANTVEEYLDHMPPTFAGIESCTHVEDRLTWQAATDDVSPQFAIAYYIYESTGVTPIDFNSSSYSSGGGEMYSLPPPLPPSSSDGAVRNAEVAFPTDFYVPSLTPGVTYNYAVRAEDEAGNMETNTNVCSFTATDVDLYFYSVASVTNTITLDFEVSNSSPAVFANSVDVLLVSYIANAVPYTPCSVFALPVVPPADTAVPGSFDISTLTTDYFMVIDPQDTVPENLEYNNFACLGTYCGTPPLPGVCLPID